VKKFLIAPNLGDGYESPQAVTDGSGNVIATYIYAGEHPIMKIGASGQVEYLLADSMGSVVGKASGGGVSIAAIKYTAFGEVASAVGASAGIDSAVGTEPRFHGMTLDAGTGLYFVRARTYDARTGRFVSRDPVDGRRRMPESYHPYTFANGNPLQWSDPTGEETLTSINFGLLAGATLAAIGLQTPTGQKFLNSLVSASAGVLNVTATVVKDTTQYTVDLGMAAIAILQSARVWEGKKVTDWLADQLDIPRRKLGEIIEALKDAAGNRGNENVKIDLDTGDVTDAETGEPIGNVHDEL
jgi:RHS repeat-associated protein